jgi:addiction module RelE/StbE family toxin
MPKTYAVDWAVTAQDDLDDILDYIMNDSPGNSMKALDRIERCAKSLTTLPDRGRIVPELKFHGVTSYRELIIKPWRLIYTITGRAVHVVSMLDSRRQLEDLLLDRFLRH